VTREKEISEKTSSYVRNSGEYRSLFDKWEKIGEALQEKKGRGKKARRTEIQPKKIREPGNEQKG